jgi:hypothetical protein
MEQIFSDFGTNFIALLSNLEFKIYFTDVKGPEGLLLFNDSSGQKFSIEPGIDYWDFDLELNGYRVNSFVTERGIVNYDHYLEEYFQKFTISHDSTQLKKHSKADSYYFLKEEIRQIKDLLQNYIILSGWGDGDSDEQTIFVNAFSHNYITLDYQDSNKYPEDDHYITLCISQFLEGHRRILGKTIQFLELKLEWLNLEKEEIFCNDNRSDSQMKTTDLVWCRNDTDLLELVTALFEMKAINSNTNTLTRKAAIEIFSKIFGLEIKDVESKLSRATERKKEVSPFLSALKESFDNYALKKQQK